MDHRTPPLREVMASRRSVIKLGLAIGLSAPLGVALAGCSDDSAGGTASQTNLSFWSRDSYVNGVLEPLMRDRLASFDKANNTKTELVYLNFADSTQKEQASFATGTSPTIAQQGPDVTLQYAAGGHLESVSDLYAKIQPSLVPLQKDAIVTWKGDTYAIPWYLQVNVLYYHKDLLQKEGLKPPTTWQEWLDTAKALTKGDAQYGFVLPGADTSAGQLWIPLATSAGGALVDETGMPTHDHEPFVEAMDFLQQLYKSAMPPASPTYQTTDSQQLFLLSKVAMVWQDAGLIPAVQQAGWSDNLGAIKIPVNKPTDTSRSFLGGFELFIFAPSKNKELGGKLIEYLLDPTWYTQYVKTSGGFALPVLKDSAADPYFSTGLISTLTSQAQTSVRYGGPVFGNAPYLGTAEANNLYSNAVVQVWTGAASPQQAVEDFFAKLTDLANK